MQSTTYTYTEEEVIEILNNVFTTVDREINSWIFARNEMAQKEALEYFIRSRGKDKEKEHEALLSLSETYGSLMMLRNLLARIDNHKPHSLWLKPKSK